MGTEWLIHRAAVLYRSGR